MKILITGICGFVGSTLAKAWIEAEAGISIYGLDNLSRPGSYLNRPVLQKLGVKLFHGDIRVASDLEHVPPVDWVVDASANPSVLAGSDGQTSSRQLIEHNLLGTCNLLEYCKRHTAGFILLSTSRVYSFTPLTLLPVKPHGQAFRLSLDHLLPHGVTATGISEYFSTTPPISLYGSSKLASEIMALEYGATFDFPVWINRCGILAGAGQFGRSDQGIISYWINNWLHRRPLTYLGFEGHGYQVRDCLHPRDLLPLLQKQSACSVKGLDTICNVGGGVKNSLSLAELSAWCNERFGQHSVSCETHTRRFDIPWLVMDSSRAKELWNWQPETSLDLILEEIACHAEGHRDWLEITGSL